MSSRTIQSLQNNILTWCGMKTAFTQIESGAYPFNIAGLSGGLLGFFLAEYFYKTKRSVLIIVPTEKEVEQVLADLDFSNIETRVLPWWGSLAYRPVSPSSSVFAERAEILSLLLQAGEEGGEADGSVSKKSDEKNPRIFITCQRSFLTPVPPGEYLKKNKCSLAVGGAVDILKVAELLTSWGYTRVPRVSVRGEFALRGEVLDVCLASNTSSLKNAYRIQFDFDKIEKIKTFDVNSQSSLEEIKSVTFFPAKEVIWDKERISVLEKNLKNLKEFSPDALRIIERLKTYKTFEGEEIFYPLCFEKQTSILDYFPKKDITVFYIDYDRQKNFFETLSREYLGLYKKAKNQFDENEKRKAVIPEFPEPQHILFQFDKLSQNYTRSVFFKTLNEKSSLSGEESFIKFYTEPARSFFGNIVYLKEELKALLNSGWTVYVFAESDNQALRIQEILHESAVHVLPFNLSAGFSIPELKILVIHENEIFGRRRRIPKSVKTAKSSVIDTFIELNPGDYVVHVNYGIGKFRGIERVKIADTERDYINLLYANDETVFIPIEQADMVQRYIGNEGEAPHLDVLGSKSWENRKTRVKKSVEDIAAKLIDLYSRRKASKGFAFQKDDEWQLSFEAAFPYEETDDQLTCIEDVKADMEKPVPMDRLICGDVGYGKTEVAMRAAFKAAMSGKQVAFLSPTTILTEQHFETLNKRFKNFPVKIARLSRFISKGEQKKVLEKLKQGEIDVLVGTHRIIQKDVVFKDLGLMIIDEEQRFGVKDKEKLKALKHNVDCLSLSATPIPRTLHMSLLKIRDMSVITTPPQNRKPVETVIEEFNAEKIADVIRRESARGGQVFYLHNRVETLEDTLFMLQSLLPEIMIETAHGQMSPNELEEIFERFSLGGFQVLIATTIIENGIDIPNANTIIIDRADMYGVSQLYQLRGRVGRSDKKAYAYLLYPEDRALSEVAMKRLQVISDFTELGSGFKIAMKDMEIRGAGNLLGREQSGDIYSVGFDLYLRLLDEAVQKLQNGNYEPMQESVIELEYSGFIPDSYINIPETKMEVYKKIAAVKTQEDLDGIYAEISDRFGPAPEEVESLLALSEIKIICNTLSISSLKERKSKVRVEFARVSKISVDKLLRMIKESDGRVTLDPKAPNVLILQTGKIGLKEKSEFIREKLGRLM
ncbi:transcription-repair coupling factor [Treponema pedis]|uniref:transcription-repair coupling factor n=1 Tax=Treponema pedis TaxID=409322 RepID=UPI00197DD464|nr:transcription-repair coupling factor [Treponema pedis]QSI05485.1 transcription-repair coupling factor [Treponema pedis]